MAAVTIRVKTTRQYGSTDSVIKELTSGVNRVVYDMARGVAASARRRAPVDTGRLRDSIEATRVVPGHWVVTVGAPYGAYVEYGTRYMAAQPFFTPAVEEYRRQFAQQLGKIIHGR